MNAYLLWLEWPERCFRLNAEDLRCFRALVPKGSRITVARSQAAFLRALPKATHVITWHFQPEWFVRAAKLTVLATPAAGQELVPTAGPKGVRIHFGGFHGAIMAESVAAFMLGWSRGFFAVREAPTGWPRTWLSDKCRMLSGTKAVIVGYGKVGHAIGVKLATLGVEAVGVTRHVSARDADLRSADWLVLALPSTTGTDDYLNARLISKLPRRCVVVNVGRGNAVDEAALVRALRSGRLAGAYLDVCKTELTAVGRRGKRVIDPENPAVPNLVLMPHASAFAPEYLRMCFKELKDDGLI